ncbi:hypothetical protein CHUAL_002708 [Chamberlinius hualienensis]
MYRYNCQKLLNIHRRFIIRNLENDSTCDKNEDEEIRRNAVNIQMLFPSLHSQIFPKHQNSSQDVNCIQIKNSINALKSHGLWGKDSPPLPPLNLKLPDLLGNNLDDHFRSIANQQCEKYKLLGDKLVKSQLPIKPSKWEMKAGWVKYSTDGSSWLTVDFPDEQALIFDVEVLVSESNLPILATAASTSAWYSWCSSRLLKDRVPVSPTFGLNDLINLETKPGQNKLPKGSNEKLIVGHNVSYDRARLKEQYFLKDTKTRFIDTMSLHIATSGLTGLQRALLMAELTGSKRKEVEEAKSRLRGPPIKNWMKVGSLNNLSDVHKLHCGGRGLDKGEVEIFIKGNIGDVQNNFNKLMTYCSNDVVATFEIFQILWPLFFQRFPHPVTFAGMLEMSVTYLPVNNNWQKYLNNSQTVYDALENELKLMLMRLANDACEFLHDQKYKNDVWLWDLDWKIISELCPKISEDEECIPGPSLISSQMQVVPKLLRLSWEGFPLHYSKKNGWGYLVPGKPLTQNVPMDQTLQFPYNQLLKDKKFAKDSDFHSKTDKISAVNVDELWDKILDGSAEVSENSELWETFMSEKMEQNVKQVNCRAGVESGSPNHHGNGPYLDENIPGCWFYRLPHKDGPNYKVGNPLAKDFLNKIEDGSLRSEAGSDADWALKLSKMISYWKNAHKRITSQMVVWLKKSELPKSVVNSEDFEEENNYGAILPSIVTAGTVTRRAVEATWMTASNAYVDRVGSELKSMIQALPGYRFVGADVDSQELWIAAVLGDAHSAGIHGSLIN